MLSKISWALSCCSSVPAELSGCSHIFCQTTWNTHHLPMSVQPSTHTCNEWPQIFFYCQFNFDQVYIKNLNSNYYTGDNYSVAYKTTHSFSLVAHSLFSSKHWDTVVGSLEAGTILWPVQMVRHRKRQKLLWYMSYFIQTHAYFILALRVLMCRSSRITLYNFYLKIKGLLLEQSSIYLLYF